MKTIFLMSFLVFFTKAFACEQGEISFPQNKVCTEVKWITAPAFNQFLSASFHLSETNLRLNVVPWMVMGGGHEHGSRPVVMTTVSPVDYLAEKIYFMGGMHGEWFLKLQLLNEKNEIIEEVRTKVDL